MQGIVTKKLETHKTRTLANPGTPSKSPFAPSSVQSSRVEDPEEVLEFDEGILDQVGHVSCVLQTTASERRPESARPQLPGQVLRTTTTVYNNDDDAVHVQPQVMKIIRLS